jgi:hypothetical protein
MVGPPRIDFPERCASRGQASFFVFADRRGVWA